MQCIQEAKQLILKEIFGNPNKSIESSSGVERNSYTGPIHNLSSIKYLFGIFNGTQLDKVFDLAKKGNISHISSGGTIMNPLECTYPSDNFNAPGYGASGVAVDTLLGRYTHVLSQALQAVENMTLAPGVKQTLGDALGADNQLSAYSADFDFYDDDDVDFDADYGADTTSAPRSTAAPTTPEQKTATNLTKIRLGNAVTMTKAKDAWAMRDQDGRPLTGHGSHVAVLDTGTDKSSPFLSGVNIETLCVSRDDGPHDTWCVDHRTSLRRGMTEPEAYSCYDEQNNYMCEHGTATASTIVGSYNGKPYGVAPNASILAINNLASKPGDIPGLTTVTNTPADYIQIFENILQETRSKNISSLSLSFGFSKMYGDTQPSDFPVLQAMLDALRSTGVVTVAAIGNTKTQDGTFPNFMDGVLSVGACRHLADGGVVKAAYSGFGPEVDMYVVSKIRVASSKVSDKDGVDGVSRIGSGTSFSAPLVAGACAILRQQAGTQIPQDKLADVVTWSLYFRANASDWHKVDGQNLRPVLDIKAACDNMQQVLNGTFSVDQLPGSDENGEVKSFKEFLPQWQQWRDKNPPSARESAPRSSDQASGGLGAGSALALLGAALGAAGAGYAALSHRGRRKERHAAERGRELQPLTNQTPKTANVAQETGV